MSLEHKVAKSNHIDSLTYTPGAKQLCVHFKNGSRKTFAAVPHHVYDEMCQQNSAGRYFHNIIKLHYRCIEDDSDDQA